MNFGFVKLKIGRGQVIWSFKGGRMSPRTLQERKLIEKSKSHPIIWTCPIQKSANRNVSAIHQKTFFYITIQKRYIFLKSHLLILPLDLYQRKRRCRLNNSENLYIFQPISRSSTHRTIIFYGTTWHTFHKNVINLSTCFSFPTLFMIKK